MAAESTAPNSRKPPEGTPFPPSATMMAPVTISANTANHPLVGRKGSTVASSAPPAIPTTVRITFSGWKGRTGFTPNRR
ncbi:MAG: hypothetical protein BWY79_01096 [Actinobacteria bacterium ADurb.Bin444]|nr:MAG: hypothetical protein BWY79_01096 [Actinobacteria bacterium ADurb.Bin444]